MLETAEPISQLRAKLGDTHYWPLLDEDIAVSTLLLGRSTIGESPKSFARWQKWLAARRSGQTTARFAAEFEEQS